MYTALISLTNANIPRVQGLVSGRRLHAKSTHVHNRYTHMHLHVARKRGWKNLQKEPWLMHEARNPAVVGVFCLITLAVCFISAWWSLMNELALSVLPCPVELSSLRGATWCPTSSSHTAGHSEMRTHLNYLSVCQSVCLSVCLLRSESMTSASAAFPWIH